MNDKINILLHQMKDELCNNIIQMGKNIKKYHNDNLFCIQIKNISSIQKCSQEAIPVKYKHTYNLQCTFCYSTDPPIIIISNIKPYTVQWHALLYTDCYWTITERMLSTRSTVHVWTHLKGLDVFSNEFIHYRHNKNVDVTHHTYIYEYLKCFVEKVNAKCYIFDAIY